MRTQPWPSSAPDFPPFNLLTTQWPRFYFRLHFTDEATEAQTEASDCDLCRQSSCLPEDLARTSSESSPHQVPARRAAFRHPCMCTSGRGWRDGEAESLPIPGRQSMRAGPAVCWARSWSVLWVEERHICLLLPCVLDLVMPFPSLILTLPLKVLAPHSSLHL